MLKSGELPNWQLLDEVSPSLVHSGIAVSDTLQAVLPSILAVDSDDTSLEEVKLRKVFKLAQLEIEYLLKTQELLMKAREKYEEELKMNKEQMKKLAETIVCAKTTRSVYNCTTCNKVFLNESFLAQHVKRRHLTPL